jgi:hypothetical protein
MASVSGRRLRPSLYLKLLAADDVPGIYVPSSDVQSGELLLVRNGPLLAQTFDARRLELKGDPTTVAQHLRTAQNLAFFRFQRTEFWFAGQAAWRRVSAHISPPKLPRMGCHSMAYSVWARTYYQQRRKKGQDHQAAVRALAFKWIRVAFRCWKDRVAYDESKYLAALARALPWLPSLQQRQGGVCKTPVVA